jgi:hypothetical protein
MRTKSLEKLTLYIFFLLYLFIGIYTLEDYGINIEEHTQLYSGFYWLNYVFEFFEIDFLKNNLKSFLNHIAQDTNLPNPSIYTYGPIFDLPTAFIDLLNNNIDNSQNFKRRHLFVFLIFFISSIVFFKILNNRFSNFFSSFFGTVLYIFSPRIYGDSFHNNKDIIFLSLVVFSIFFIFKLFKKKKIKNIIFFSLFAALATSTRIMGLFLPVSLILFFFLEKQNIKLKNNFKYICLTIISYFFFLYVHFPFLWEAPFENFIKYITNSRDWVFSYYILFNGEYVLTTSLPDSYIFAWIGISTPILNLILFFCGFILIFKRLFIRVININEFTHYNCDFWRSKKEMKDNFIIFNLISILSILIFLNVSLVSGWRHLYFLNIFIIYIGIFFLNFIFIKFKKHQMKLILFFLLLFTPNIYKIFIFHPFQSLYLNEILSKSDKNKFLIDREGLSRLDSINKILDLENNNNIISIANASFIPYYRIKDKLSKKQQIRLKFVGREYENSDYIYNNYVYEVDPAFNNKYVIPSNFQQIYSLEIDGIKIYEIYKKKFKIK